MSETKQPSSFYEAFFVLVIAFALILYRAWILKILWHWYAPVISDQLPALSYHQALALNVLLSLATSHNHDYQPKTDKVAHRVLGWLLGNTLMLPLGWLLWLVIR